MTDSAFNHLPLRGEYITFTQALKVVGLVDSGGQAKEAIRHGGFVVNDVAEIRPGRKLRCGDRFGISGGRQWTVVEGSATSD